MKKIKRKRRHKRIRMKIKGTPERPRLSIFRTNQHFYAQIIDDTKGITLASANSLQIKDKLTNKEKVIKVAENLAKVATDKGIKKIVFDRGGFSYKGRIKIFAEEFRKKGFEF